MDGFLGYAVSEGIPGHPTPYMREPHILVRMRHPSDMPDASRRLPGKIAGLLVVYDFASQEGVTQMTMTLSKVPPKK